MKSIAHGDPLLLGRIEVVLEPLDVARARRGRALRREHRVFGNEIHDRRKRKEERKKAKKRAALAAAKKPAKK